MLMAAKVKQEKGTPRDLAELGPGQFFGERALLKAEPASRAPRSGRPASRAACAARRRADAPARVQASASIVVSSELVAYCCDRETFTPFSPPLATPSLATPP